MGAGLAVFDTYGTLFDVSSAARALAEAPGQEALRRHWQALSESWRAKQLEYSWLRAITGVHADFWTVTGDALDWALERHDLDGGAGLRGDLMALYRRLSAYPEVAGVLAALRGAGVRAAILSNGSPEMLADATASAGLDAHLDAVLSVEAAGVFKPAAAVYDLVGARYPDMARADVLFVSSNGWDVCSAAGYGFATLWVNRAGAPVDRLPAGPDATGSDLRAVLARGREMGWSI